ncbi:MAG: DNA polymerase III subunit alpha [Gemmatimonadaceae bacterium]|jgi:error-prone DNA polymerase|nr:DNA polymerase III subunit alpha [Gemmatimonadaceae bacterium]
MTGFVELHCRSTFSLLDGATQPEGLVARAAALGMPALALTDRDDVGGAVRFAQAAAEAGVGGILGAELSLVPPRAPWAAPETPSRATPLVVLAESRAGWGNLAQAITRARLDQPRGIPGLSLDTLAGLTGGCYALTGGPRGWVPALVAAGREDDACDALAQLRDAFDGRVAVEVWDHGLPEERTIVAGLLRIARALDAPWVVSNDVHYAEPSGRLVHDVQVALRHGRPLDQLGTRLKPNGEWYLKAGAQLARRWRDHPAGLRQSLAIAERCAFRLKDLRPHLPDFPLPSGVGADEYLARLVAQGADERWGPPGTTRRTAKHEAQLAHELGLIAKLGFAGYFLIVWDIVRFARREGILCQGRGSAANSAVCYCLGITAVDPIALELLFERFLSEERKEAPDIDIDFAHEERERVLQYVYDRYGREHAAMVCEHITWRGRSAARDAARALGFSTAQADAIAKWSDRFSARATADALRRALGEAPKHAEPADPFAPARDVVQGPANYSKHQDAPIAGHDDDVRKITTEHRTWKLPGMQPDPGAALLARIGLDADDRRVRMLPEILDGLHKAPRHRGIHVGGFVITREPLATVVPIEPAAMAERTVIQWEKDDLDPAGLVKIDLLGLGMLTCLQKCLRYVREQRGVTIDLGQLPMHDQAVYDDLCRADTVGLFQVESRAQMNTLPRLKPRCFYDIVVEVALIRPGPIQGEMVHPYLRRKNGEEPVTYPHPVLEPILRRTLGVPLFQEQGMQVAIAAAGFTAGEADLLRKAMGHKRSRERMADICLKMVEGMRANGIPEDVARRIYNQINAFADYGFPESHAASFALIVYASAYLRHYYAPEFLAAILNSQPMGFYAPGTLIEDAKRHGVVVRPVDLRVSAWDHTLETDPRRGAEEERRGAQRGALGGRTTDVDAPPKAPLCDLPLCPSAPLRKAVPPAVRLGLRLVKGLGSRARDQLAAARAAGPFTSVEDVVHRTRLPEDALRALCEAGAFDGMFEHLPTAERRRAALWAVLAARRGSAGPLAPPVSRPAPAAGALPAMRDVEMTEADYRMTGVSLAGHPMRHLRPMLEPNGVRRIDDLVARGRDGERVAVAGLVICRQRPGTAKGFVFLTLEDETGLLNVVITPKRFEAQALVITGSPLLLVRGTLQVEKNVVNVRAEQCRGLTAEAGEGAVRSRDFR